MITRVVLAKLSPTMEEGTIVKWSKQEGDAIKVGDVLAEIETDKANMEMEALGAGVLRKVLVPAGGKAPIGHADRRDRGRGRGHRGDARRGQQGRGRRAGSRCRGCPRQPLRRRRGSRRSRSGAARARRRRAPPRHRRRP